VVAKSLRNAKVSHKLAVIFTAANVSQEAQDRLATGYDILIPVEPMSGISTKNLAIIGRPDLHMTLTKIQLWGLTQFKRVLYLDADTLVLQNLDHLLDHVPPGVDFAAAPELAYPDVFNAGMMLLTPKDSTYRELCEFAKVHESYDGGDQGILNVFFGDGTRGHPANEIVSAAKATNGVQNGDAAVSADASAEPKRNWFRLSFTYNMEMHRVFRLNIPAVRRYKNERKVLHFIGKEKPWHFDDGNVPAPENASPYSEFYAEMVGKWWEVRRSLGQ
jgi:glycogenin glucosyltransferase